MKSISSTLVATALLVRCFAWSPSSQLFLQKNNGDTSWNDSSKHLPLAGIYLDLHHVTHLTDGTTRLPPMVSVPCSAYCANDRILLKELIKPPNVEALYDWYVDIQNQPSADPSWAIIWPTAVSLANHLLAPANETSSIGGKKVIELGCGLGLAGLTAAAMGADQLVLTDREPFALHCALSTAASNNMSTTTGQVRGALLDWNDDDIADDLVQTFDVILASDVLYDKESVDAFCKVCQKVGKPGALILVTDPKKERVVGVRALLKESIQRIQNDLSWQQIDLPIPTSNSVSVNEPERPSLDGKDHDLRMQEKTVLLSFRLPD